MSLPQRLQVVERVVLSAGLDPYLSVGAAAQYTSLSQRTIRGLLSDPVQPLPYHRVGARVLLRRSDLDCYLAQHRHVGVDLMGKIDRLQGRRRRRRVTRAVP
jgi:excisionase family DNA binding protein